MARAQLLYCVTDNEVFDALLSGRQQFNEKALLNIARQRGIYYSSQEDRVSLINKISSLTFGFHEIAALQAEFERSGRGEKTTSFRLNTALTLEEIKTITETYSVVAKEEGDKASIYPIGETGFTVDLKYDELDLSRTRLRQKQTKEARIEFKNVDGVTIVTLPATEKSRHVAEFLAEKVRSVKQEKVSVDEVDLSILTDSNSRTEFFLRLMSAIPKFKPNNVTKVRVDSKIAASDADNDDTEESSNNEEADEMLAVVKAVALQGQSLLSSSEFQGLRSRGFYITSIQWSAKRTESPYEIVEFDAAFADPEAGTGFKYSARGWSTYKDGKYTKGFNVMPQQEKAKMLQELEQSAMKVFKELQAEVISSAAAIIVIPEVGGQ